MVKRTRPAGAHLALPPNFIPRNLLCGYSSQEDLVTSIKNLLIRVAEGNYNGGQRTLTAEELYSALNMQMFGWNHKGSYWAGLLGRILADINGFCYEENMPLLGSLVVASSDNRYIANSGFYTILEYGDYKDEFREASGTEFNIHSEFDRISFSAWHQSKCYMYFASRRKRRKD